MFVKFTKIAVALSLAFIACACSNDGDLLSGNGATSSTHAACMSKPKAMEEFSEILSKAVSNNSSVRSFLKEQALAKFDNNHDVFYPLVKDQRINGRKFKDILAQYASSSLSLDSIEASVPLLNIYIPELAGFKIEDLDVSDDELPVLYGKNLYVNGSVADTLAADAVPAFGVLSVCESSTVQQIAHVNRGISENTINETYEFVDACFNPSLTPSRDSRATYIEYDEENPKYDKGYVDASDLDPDLVKSYENSNGNYYAQRYLMYYNLTNQEQTPTQVNGKVCDCVYALKLSPSGLDKILETAQGGIKQDHKVFTENSYTVYKAEAERPTVLSKLLTGQTIGLTFYVENVTAEEVKEPKVLKVYATPDKFFNLSVNVNRRHKTKFRHTRYTYTIDKKDVKAKWFYPLENGCRTLFDSWDIASEPLQKRFLVYLDNPNCGQKITKEDTYTYQISKSSELSGNVKLDNLLKIIGLGLSGKKSSSHVDTHTITTKMEVSETDLYLADFQIDFFNDYPLLNKDADKFVLNKNGSNSIEISVVPVNVRHYNEKYRINKDGK